MGAEPTPAYSAPASAYGTGCLGLGLRTTCFAAALITLAESTLWLALSVTAFVVHATCSFEVPTDLNLSLRLTYILYFLDPDCYNDNPDSLSILTPPKYKGHDLKIVSDGVATAKRTATLSLVYTALAFLWLGASVLLLGTLVGRVSGRAGARLCYPWIVVTASTMVFDLVATGFYGSDAADFTTVDAVAAVTGVTIPAEWLADSDSFPLKTGALLLLAFTTRGTVVWLLNGVLLVHVVRAVNAMKHEGMCRAAPPSPKVAEPKTSPSASPKPITSDTVKPEPVGRMQTQVQPDTTSLASVPAGLGLGFDAPPPVQHQQHAMHRPLAPVVGVKRSHSNVQPGEPRYPAGRYAHPGGYRERAFDKSPPQPPPKLLTGRLSDRMSFRRVSPSPSPRQLGRGPTARLRAAERDLHAGAVSPAIEAKINKIFRGASPPTPRQAAGAPLAAPVDPHTEQTHWEYFDDIIPDDDVFAPSPSQRSQVAPQPQPLRTDPGLRRVREFEDALPQPRWRHHSSDLPGRPKLDRVQSERTFGEWHLSPRPPGNLHGFSPQRPTDVNLVHDINEELKKELPWSYLEAAEPGDPRAAQMAPPKVVHNVYLPTGREGDREFKRSSSSMSSSRTDPYSRDVLY